MLARVKCRDAKNTVEDAVPVAKGKCVRTQVEKMNRMKTNPKEAWTHVKILKEGLASHHETRISMKFKDEGHLKHVLFDRPRKNFTLT